MGVLLARVAVTQKKPAVLPVAATTHKVPHRFPKALKFVFSEARELHARLSSYPLTFLTRSPRQSQEGGVFTSALEEREGREAQATPLACNPEAGRAGLKPGPARGPSPSPPAPGRPGPPPGEWVESGPIFPPRLLFLQILRECS